MSAGISITPSHIIQYLYCPRFTWFEYVLTLPQYEEKQHKVMRGRELHDRKLEENKGYLRKRIGVKDKQEDIYLTNGLLRGRVDEVLTLQDDTLAPLDYKFARYEGKLYDTYKTQLYCYAWLIEENYGGEVNCGYIVYTRSKNKLLEVPVARKDVEKVKAAADSIQTIIGGKTYPKATKYKKRCLSCTYRNVCTQ
ncbi:CRISPR-associated protein Cas4 [Roseivirga sp. BDSF3-8]|uniref:CRISPR-associated protein Cas4 n=1 Tax=Roseivirga sp. BDSF3-8 TaxID=3241598 RepID=UPI0035323100